MWNYSNQYNEFIRKMFACEVDADVDILREEIRSSNIHRTEKRWLYEALDTANNEVLGSNGEILYVSKLDKNTARRAFSRFVEDYEAYNNHKINLTKLNFGFYMKSKFD